MHAPRLHPVSEAPPPPPRLAEILRAQGLITAQDVSDALAQQAHLDLPIGEILVLQGRITEDQLLRALATQFGTRLLPEEAQAPDAGLAHKLPASLAIRFSAVPLRMVGPALVVLTNRPDLGVDLRDGLEHDGPVLFAIATRHQMKQALTTIYGNDLIRLAEAYPADAMSCRTWRARKAMQRAALAGAAVLAVALWSPVALLIGIYAVALGIAGSNALLKWLAVHEMSKQAPPAPPPGPDLAQDQRDPVVTVMLPLFKEPDIAGHLVQRVARLDYPRELLDVLLLIEEGDSTTRDALARADLPFWMRAIIIPPGHPQTKPRAMNYGLNFARGSVVGVYDAEDAPEPDQLRKVVERFREVPPEVVCLQGQLDYYNPGHNWLSRCFTLEYATWFRLLLPGVQRLGLFVPLGGTTLFFRRTALEEMGAWDAHNVTEDADLGLRLARNGYKTEIVETTTFEEANAAPLPWVKQRSRWLKGYAMTWATHMRDPVQLWRDLGPRRFIGLQVQLLGTVFGFALAPVLWSLVIKLFGWPHPLDAVVPPGGYLGLALFFLSTQMLTFLATWRATAQARHRRLRRWIPVLDVYFLLASAATLLGLLELLVSPFHWRKTAHGQFSGAAETAPPTQTDQSAPASSLSRTSNAVDK
ncbi:glycosyltransferase family 2 protein [Nioella nitratireducens]|uniref:glycosyltransferase family 2 protein n=1 Tax=Nioella nitratireducens TaxID=1287720 RepID=UPI0008FD34C2|nr:glycosyltransferase family 2 protein [Nioella nitratireducens]